MTEHNTKTTNHGYTIPEEGEIDWHIPINANFEKIDISAEIRATESELDEYEPKTSAKFLATDSGKIFIGDGEQWNHQFTIGESNLSNVKGINRTRTHVGPMYQGEYHQGTAGIMFWAEEGLSIHSAVIDSDLSNNSATILPIELREYDDGTIDPPLIGTIDVELSGGPERIDLSGLPDIPADGEYVLSRTDSPNGENIPCRRIHEDNWGASRYADYTYSSIDLIKGTFPTQSGDYGSEGYYYYFFDMEVGDPRARVTSPWSTDVDEIYMRPRDPEEEFNDISPRALWIDTS